MSVIDWCERGLVPDVLARAGMRRLMAQRLRDERADDPEACAERHARFVEKLRGSPIAVETRAANEQHYEVPAEFFHRHLGPHLKYSCCWYPAGNESLGEAEEKMLELYAERAELRDGQQVLDLGCGWGSLSLWLARRFPNSRITGLSNSHGQREFIEARARERGLSNLVIHTGNVVDFDFPATQRFDRVLSIEMFEHMRNYGLLLAKIARWLAGGGKLFVHIFAHRTLAYPFQDEGASDWMTRHFFTGGLMPSERLLLHFQDHLALERQWWVDGRHYEKTSNHWLAGLDAARAQVLPVLEQAYGRDAARWLQRWRMFYMACAELFGYDRGRQWGVAHYRFMRRQGS